MFNLLKNIQENFFKVSDFNKKNTEYNILYNFLIIVCAFYPVLFCDYLLNFLFELFNFFVKNFINFLFENFKYCHY